MTQANDSITVTPGTGATVATHSVDSKEHQVMIVADPAGRLLGTPMAFRSDNAGAGVTYFGFAAPGTAEGSAGWRISKETITSGDSSIVWADGDASFDNVWTNRASLSYS